MTVENPNLIKAEDILERVRKAFADTRDKATDAMTQCHNAIQMNIEGHDPVPSLQCKEAHKGFIAFLACEMMNHVGRLESEVAVYSARHDYAAKFDAIARINDNRFPIDFKPFKGIGDELSYQVYAYRQAYIEMLQGEQKLLEHLTVPNLDKANAEPSLVTVFNNIEPNTQLFNTLCIAQYLQKYRKHKNNPFVSSATLQREVPF